MMVQNETDFRRNSSWTIRSDNKAILSNKSGIGTVHESVVSPKKTQTAIENDIQRKTKSSVGTSKSKTLDLGCSSERSQWDKWVGRIWQGVHQVNVEINTMVSKASVAFTPHIFQTLLDKSSFILLLICKNQALTMLQRAGQQQPNINFFETNGAGTRARETTAFAESLVLVTDALLRNGYVMGDPTSKSVAKTNITLLQNVPMLQSSKPLFFDFTSASEINKNTPETMKIAEMGALAGAIYEETIPRTPALHHTIVAQGLTNDVAWMVTDSLADHQSFDTRINGNGNDLESFLVGTITVRGFDASDETVDRERLLMNVVNATSEEIKTVTSQSLLVHSGLLQIARSIYEDVKPFIIESAPKHKIVFNGHSIGGSISFLLLLLFSQEHGSEYAKERIAKVYTFGSPPVVAIKDSSEKSKSANGQCEILDSLALPTDILFAFVQPWDPLCRLFSTIDPFYHIIGDIADDGYTVWASGPYRTMRHVAKAIFKAWAGWPRFRDVFRQSASQAYVSVGTQHLLLPEPTRYLSDRFMPLNVLVPRVATIVRLSSSELYPALKTLFPLDAFEVSFVPQAIRSLVHHLHPAYGSPISDYLKELERHSRFLPKRSAEFVLPRNKVTNEQPSVELVADEWKINGIDCRKVVLRLMD